MSEVVNGELVQLVPLLRRKLPVAPGMLNPVPPLSVATTSSRELSSVPVVMLLGSVDYYSRFGFVPAQSIGVIPPDPGWGEHFQARPLHRWTPGSTGAFEYAAPFGEL